MTALGWLVAALMVGKVAGVITAVVVHDWRAHERWLDDIERQHGPGRRAVAEAEFIVGRWDRRPLRWIRRWAL